MIDMYTWQAYKSIFENSLGRHIGIDWVNLLNKINFVENNEVLLPQLSVIFLKSEQRTRVPTTFDRPTMASLVIIAC